MKTETSYKSNYSPETVMKLSIAVILLFILMGLAV